VSINGEQSSVSFYVPNGSAGLENSYSRGIVCSAFLSHAGEFSTASCSVDSFFSACSENTEHVFFSQLKLRSHQLSLVCCLATAALS